MVKKIFYNGLADIISITTGLLSSIVLVRFLGPEHWGYYSQVTWLVGFVGTFFSFGLTYTAIRYLSLLSAQKSASKIQPLVFWISFTQLVLAAIGGTLLFLFAPQLITLIGWKLNAWLVRLAGIGLFSFTMLQLALAILRGLQEFRMLSLTTVALNIALIGAVAITMFYPSVEVLILSVAVGQLILLPVVFSQIWRRVYSYGQIIIEGMSDASVRWRSVVKYAGFVFASVIVDQVVWQRSEIFFLAQLNDASASGYYGLAYTTTQLAIGTIPVALTGTLTPIFSSLVGAEDSSAIASSYQNTFSFLNLILLPLSIGFFIIAPDVLAILYGDAYSEVVPILRILIISSAIGIYARPSASIIHAINKPQILLIGSLLALPIDLVLAWRLVPIWGAQGAAVANLVAQAVAAGVAMGYTAFSVRLRYDFPAIGKSALSAVACGFVAWLTCLMGMASMVSVVLAIMLGALTYITILIWMRDNPTLKAILWIRSQVFRYLSTYAH